MNTFLVMSDGAAAVIVIIGLAVYFIPTIVAYGNNNSTTVFLVNLFFGWTLIGWVIALILAFADSKPVVVVQQNDKASKYDQLEKLNQLREKGVLSTEEFIIEKEKIMKA